jgi:hypothetical protein
LRWPGQVADLADGQERALAEQQDSDVIIESCSLLVGSVQEEVAELRQRLAALEQERAAGPPTPGEDRDGGAEPQSPVGRGPSLETLSPLPPAERRQRLEEHRELHARHATELAALDARRRPQQAVAPPPLASAVPPPLASATPPPLDSAPPAAPTDESHEF